MGLDEVGTARTLREHRAVTDALVEKHGGRIVKTTGDGVLLEFPSVVDAVECAVAVQAVMAERNQDVPDDQRMLFRIGINLGDILIEGDDILGDGVNVAARLEGIAEPGGICISSFAYDQVRGKVPVDFTDLGEQTLKNITRPVKAYACRIGSAIGSVAVGSSSMSTLGNKLLQLPKKPSIAVLPFDNFSSDVEQGYFADGITEDIITTLSYISSLFVIARNSCFIYKGKARDLRKVGEELGVRYVLEGSVRRSVDRIRVTAQLIDAITGNHLWADRYDRPLKDVFDIQDELTKEIVSALRVVLTEGEEARVWQRSTNNVGAWGDAVRGFDYIWRGTAADIIAARKYLTSAIAQDPMYAKAIAMLACTHYFDVRFAYTNAIEEAKRQLAELTDQALALDPNEPYAIAMKANVLVFEERFDEAIEVAKRATAISPNDALIWLALARDYISGGRPEEGEQAIRTGMRLNPFFPVNYLAVLGDALVHQGKNSEALDVLCELVRRNKNYISAHLHLAGLYSEAGELDKVRQEIAEVLRINPSYRVPMAKNFYLSSDAVRKEAFLDALRRGGLPT
jgi:adenylate cyclase